MVTLLHEYLAFQCGFISCGTVSLLILLPFLSSRTKVHPDQTFMLHYRDYKKIRVGVWPTLHTPISNIAVVQLLISQGHHQLVPGGIFTMSWNIQCMSDMAADSRMTGYPTTGCCQLIGVLCFDSLLSVCTADVNKGPRLRQCHSPTGSTLARVTYLQTMSLLKIDPHK